MSELVEPTIDYEIAEQIIDFARDHGVHNQATPEPAPERIDLATKLVNACTGAYRGGAGNRGETVVGVLSLAGALIEDGGGGEQEAEAEAPAAENGGQAQPGAQAADPGPQAGAEPNGAGAEHPDGGAEEI